MFPHTITIYSHTISGDNDLYDRQVIKDVYIQESIGAVKDGNGISNSNSLTVTTSKALCDSFGYDWHISVNDRVVKGVGPEIIKYSDLERAYVVKGIEINQCGSNTDNIVIKGV